MGFLIIGVIFLIAGKRYSESLTDRQLQYEQIKAMKELAQSSNAKMIIMGKGNTPLILNNE